METRLLERPSKRKERNKLRLKTYSKYGYKTLVINQEELKNINKTKNKIIGFHNV